MKEKKKKNSRGKKKDKVKVMLSVNMRYKIHILALCLNRKKINKMSLNFYQNENLVSQYISDKRALSVCTPDGLLVIIIIMTSTKFSE